MIIYYYFIIIYDILNYLLIGYSPFFLQYDFDSEAINQLYFFSSLALEKTLN